MRARHRRRKTATFNAVSCTILNDEYNFQAILLMDPGALGHFGAIAVGRVGQGRDSANTVVHTLPIAMEDHARVQYKRKTSAVCPPAVSCGYYHI